MVIHERAILIGKILDRDDDYGYRFMLMMMHVECQKDSVVTWMYMFVSDDTGKYDTEYERRMQQMKSTLHSQAVSYSFKRLFFHYRSCILLLLAYQLFL